MSIHLLKWFYIALTTFSCLLLVFIPIAANTQGTVVFIDDHDITRGNDALDWSRFLEEQQFLSVYQQSYISSLIEAYDVINFDIESERVLLYLSDKSQSFLRLASWDTILGQYNVKDTACLPAESYLDTYHDGDSILLMTPIEEDMITGSIPVCSQLYLTFEYVEDDWYLTHFTDGQTFVATLQNEAYLFDDYYETSEEYAWQVPNVFSFEGFNPIELIPYISEYNSVMPNRPSLIETL